MKTVAAGILTVICTGLLAFMGNSVLDLYAVKADVSVLKESKKNQKARLDNIHDDIKTLRQGQRIILLELKKR